MKIFILGVILASTNMVLAQNQLAGYVYYHGDENSPMENTDVGLYDTLNTLVYCTQTDVNGFYQFDSIVDGTYVVKSNTNEEVVGVDITDAHHLLLYLLGMYQLGPMELVAADVDGNGTVEWLDYIIFVVNYLLHNEPFPAGDWVSQEHYVEFASRGDNDTLISWQSEVGQTGGGGGRSDHLIRTLVEQIDVSDQRMTVEIPCSELDDITGFNFSLSYPSEMITILNVEGPDENLHYHIDKERDLLSFVWIDQNPFGIREFTDNNLLTITFELIDNNITSGSFECVRGGDFIGLDGNKIGDIELTLPELKRSASQQVSVTAYPNPVINHLTFTIQQEQNAHGNLLIFDTQGRVVEQHTLSLNEGQNNIKLNTERYMPGHYFYLLNIGDPVAHSYQGRMYKSSR